MFNFSQPKLFHNYSLLLCIIRGTFCYISTNFIELLKKAASDQIALKDDIALVFNVVNKAILV